MQRNFIISIIDMETKSNIYKDEMFEGEEFVRECLEAFDEKVSAIESEYAFTNKSA